LPEKTDLTKRKRHPTKGIYIAKNKDKSYLKAVATPIPRYHREIVEIIQNELLTEYNIKISLTSLISHILDDILPSPSHSIQFKIYMKKLVKKIIDSTENEESYQLSD